MVSGGTIEIVCLRLVWWRGGRCGGDWHGECFCVCVCGCCGLVFGFGCCVVYGFGGSMVASFLWLLWWFLGGSCCGQS